MGLTSIYNQRPSGLFQSNAISDWMIWYRTWPLQTIQLTVGLAHQFENTPTSCTSSRPREKNTASLEFTRGNAGWELQGRLAQEWHKQKTKIKNIASLEFTRWNAGWELQRTTGAITAIYDYQLCPLLGFSWNRNSNMCNWLQDVLTGNVRNSVMMADL